MNTQSPYNPNVFPRESDTTTTISRATALCHGSFSLPLYPASPEPGGAASSGQATWASRSIGGTQAVPTIRESHLQSWSRFECFWFTKMFSKDAAPLGSNGFRDHWFYVFPCVSIKTRYFRVFRWYKLQGICKSTVQHNCVNWCELATVSCSPTQVLLLLA